MRECMWKKFAGPLEALAPDPALNKSELIQARLAEAQVPSRNQTRYTFIPAAVGSENGFMDLRQMNAKQMIRGGAHSTPPVEEGGVTKWVKSKMPWAQKDTLRVHVVDVVTWLAESFREQDYVFIKMDVECAEHAIIDAWLKTGVGRLVDKLAWECHSGCGGGSLQRNGYACSQTERRLRNSTNATIIHEGSKQHNFYGYDSFSSPDLYYPEC